MAYATRADMDARFGKQEMLDLATDPDNPAADRSVGALADASAEIDSAIAEKYALPLPSGETFPLLRSAACDLARARLYDDKVPDAVRDQARRARRTLESIAAGERAIVTLGPPPVRIEPAVEAGGGDVRFEGAAPQMTRDELAGF